MTIDLRLPQITGSTEREQLSQIKSYLYQMTEQLQFALNSMDETLGKVTEVKTSTLPKNVQEEAEAQSSFNAIKSLIIKSADIVAAYYEEMNRMLKGEYVAQSDFGTYKESTEQSITENAEGIEQAFTNIQSIETDIETIAYTLAEVNAYIKSGLLYNDDNGIPVYGLEIGQKNIIEDVEVFNRFARFTADRLSFYDQNDTEVAYISNYKLYIANVEVLTSIKVGGLKDTVLANGDVVTKFVGAGGDE